MEARIERVLKEIEMEEYLADEMHEEEMLRDE